MSTVIDPTQSGIVASFKRGAWTSHVIDRNHPSRNHGVPQTIRYMVRLDYPNGFNTDWPIRYSAGRFGYDQPFPPRDAIRATRAAYAWIDQQPAS